MSNVKIDSSILPQSDSGLRIPPKSEGSLPAGKEQKPAPQGDTVTLSLAAKTGASSAAGAVLSDDEATKVSESLRTQLNDQALSATARQNQSILSLLR